MLSAESSVLRGKCRVSADSSVSRGKCVVC